MYEWELFGSTPGAPVVLSSPYTHGLRSTAVPAPAAALRALVYGPRQYGIDLVWFGV